MDTTTINSFTKDLFDTLRLDWNPHAKARDLLSEIIISEETLETVLEDVVFSLNQFLDYVRDVKGIPLTDKKSVPFTLMDECNYILKVGNSDKSNIIFVITVDLYMGGYIFRRTTTSEAIEDRKCETLDELKIHLLLWFDEFYKNIEEGI